MNPAPLQATEAKQVKHPTTKVREGEVDALIDLLFEIAQLSLPSKNDGNEKG